MTLILLKYKSKLFDYSIRERTETTTDGGIEVVSAESVRLAAVLAALMEEQSTTTSNKRKGMFKTGQVHVDWLLVQARLTIDFLVLFLI